MVTMNTGHVTEGGQRLGDLTVSLVWTSDIDAQIGTGGSFSTTLSDGNHTITASVTIRAAVPEARLVSAGHSGCYCSSSTSRTTRISVEQT